MKILSLPTGFKLLNFLVIIFPISFFFGNLLVNLEIFLICIVGILTFQKKIFLEKNKIILLLVLFFALVIVATAFDLFYKDPQNKSLIKSILYLRYLVLIFVLTCFFKSGKFNFKYFLYSCAICSSLIAVDLIFQYLSGTSFFGNEKIDLSTFKTQNIKTGGYLQRFAIIPLFFLPLFLKNQKNILLISLISLTVFFSAILFSANRMPLVMYLVFIVLSIILIKELRLPFLIGLISCVIVFATVFNTDKDFKLYYESFYGNAITIIPNIVEHINKKYPELSKDRYFVGDLVTGKHGGEKKGQVVVSRDKKKLDKKFDIIGQGSGHVIIYLTAIDTLQDSLFIGHGIKSFRVKCLGTLYLPNRVCGSHPHNYYLELLNDVGLVGTFLLLAVIIYLLLNIFKLRKLKTGEKLSCCCFAILLMIEFFPLKSSGSFFSTQNSCFVFLILTMMMNYKFLTFGDGGKKYSF